MKAEAVGFVGYCLEDWECVAVSNGLVQGCGRGELGRGRGGRRAELWARIYPPVQNGPVTGAGSIVKLRAIKGGTEGKQ
jgi:hypothetical protein